MPEVFEIWMFAVREFWSIDKDVFEGWRILLRCSSCWAGPFRCSGSRCAGGSGDRCLRCFLPDKQWPGGSLGRRVVGNGEGLPCGCRSRCSGCTALATSCVLHAALPVSGRPKMVAVSFSVARRLTLLQQCLPLWTKVRCREDELAVVQSAPVATKSNSATVWLPPSSSLLAVGSVVCFFHVLALRKQCRDLSLLMHC